MSLLSSLLRSLGLRPAPEPLQPHAFASAFLRALGTAAPGLDVTHDAALELVIRDADGSASRVYLANAFREYLREPTALDAVLERYVGSLLEARSGGPVTPSSIVPVIKDRQWLEEMRRAAADVAPQQVAESLNEELVIVYAEDGPRNIKYFTPGDLKASGLRTDNLRTLAVANLRRILPQVRLHRGPLVSMLTAGADYVSSLLLLDDLWSRATLAVDGEIVVAVPSREVLLVTGSRNERGVEKLYAMAREAVARSAYAITSTLFVYRERSFQIFGR